MSAREKKALLAHWLAQHKTTTREREEAREDLEMWFKRAKLALDAGEVELARAAKDKATEAREEYRVATARLIRIEEELERIRSEKTVPDEEEAAAARARAEHTAAEFQKIGIDPRFAALAPGGTAPPAAEDHQSALAEAEALLSESLSEDRPRTSAGEISSRPRAEGEAPGEISSRPRAEGEPTPEVPEL